MDALLPSEVARLVLGYLQEQKCDEAAKIFMETSPLLQECRLVSQKGGRYSTKVGGSSLIDILDKFCAANAMVQDKLNKVSDSEQLKQCNDILEQLSYLLEGSRKRFVVNINYSSQTSPAGHFGLQNISNSSKKRRIDGESRGKRVSRSLNVSMDKSSKSQASQDCDTVEATDLDSLIRNQKSLTQQIINTENERFSNQLSNVNIINNVKESKVSTLLNVNSDVNIEFMNSNANNYKNQATETYRDNETTKNINKCTAETSTEKLMNYCNTEVQTGFNLFDTDSNVNSELRTEPIQNISILTQELINRKELHQRIAENINKAILPIESSFGEDNQNSNVSDLNKSKLSDVIKTAVKATESDLEGILREIFDVNKQYAQPEAYNNVNTDIRYNLMPEVIDIDHGDDFHLDMQEVCKPVQNDQEHSTTTEVPIKQRLRSSSKCFNSHEDIKDSNTLIENQNAEAIMSIINCNANCKKNSMLDSELISENSVEASNTKVVNENITNIENSLAKTETKKSTDKKSKSKKTNAKKSTAKKETQKKYSKKLKKPIVEEEGVPTIVLCSEVLPSKSSHVAIASKEGEPSMISDSEELPTLSYRVVNVPKHLVKPEQIVMSNISNTIMQKTLEEYHVCSAPTENATIVPVVMQRNESSTPSASELITLYGIQENVDANTATVPSIIDMPIISLDGTTMIGTALSPFFKDSAVSVEPGIVDIIVLPNSESTELTEKRVDSVKETPKVIEESVDNGKSIIASNDSEQVNRLDASVKLKTEEIIAKRTPNSLLKSRSKNNRLSLSTPRRRNSHIRALDFSTPVKPSSITRKSIQSCIKPSVCRAGLFKSPIYEDREEPNIVQTTSKTTTKKVRTLIPMKSLPQVDLTNVPIATRSPMAKLTGNWNKIAGIGMILNESSTGESSPEKSQPDCFMLQHQTSLSSVSPEPMKETVDSNILHKSWDSDLRKIVGNSDDEEEEERTKPMCRKKCEQESSTVKIKTKNKSDVKKEIEVHKDTKKSDNVKKDIQVEEDSKISENVNKDIEAEKNLKKDNNVKRESKNSSTRISNFNDDVKREQKKNENDEMKDNKKQDKIFNHNETSQIKYSDMKAKNSSKISFEIPNQENIRITPPLDKKSKPKTTFDDSSINRTQSPRNSLQTLCIASQILDLETPRKIETTICVPPTPRVFATPLNSLRKASAVKANITIKDFIETPDFPITPCIVITPKIVEEENTEKRPSPYYEPSEEIMKEINEKIKTKETITTKVMKNSVTELKDHEPVEITQCHIVEKNMLQEKKQEQPSEHYAKNDSKNTSNDASKDSSKESANIEDFNSNINSSSESDGESSNESSTSSSSSSSNTSSSSVTSSPESSPEKPIPNTRDVIKKYIYDYTDVAMDNPVSLMQSFSDINQEKITNLKAKIKDSSLQKKVFSITTKPLEEVSKETPIKDENEEAVVSETPSILEVERTRDSTNRIPRLSAALAISSQNASTSSSKDISTYLKEIPSEGKNTGTVTSDKPSVLKTMLKQQCDSTSMIFQPSANSSQNILTSCSRDISSEISTSEQSTTNKNPNTKPKIIKIENCKFKVSKMLQSEIALVSTNTIQKQSLSNKDAKLSQVLEEKRLRVMAKFKGKMETKPVIRPKRRVDDKQKKITITSKTTNKEKSPSMNDNFKSKSSEQSHTVVEEKLMSNNNGKDVIKQEEKTMVTRRSKVFQKVDEEDLKENKMAKNRSSSRKKTEQISKKIESSDSEVNDKKNKEPKVVKEMIFTNSVISAENSKGILKAKIDLVKRDLFSDEENNDQRTTRSQSTRRSSFLESQKNSEESASNDNSKLLECLQLIPANKSDSENHNVNEANEKDVNTSGSNRLDISVKYNESVPIKKRRHNYSNCELQSEYVLQMDVEDDIILKVTPYKEMFQMNPSTKSKKKNLSPKKSPFKICKEKIKKSKKDDTPQASSLPLVTSTSNKDDEEKKRKPSKRKASTTEDKKADNKSNPLSLLKKVKIEDFLKSVHEKRM